MCKMYFVALSLTLVVSFASSDDGYANSSLPSKDQLIAGGTVITTGNERLSVASVRFSNIQGSFHLCGGFVINKRWVGTAAQCLTGQTINNTVVAVGTMAVAAGRIHELDQIEKHHNYNVTTLIMFLGRIYFVYSCCFYSQRRC